MNRIGPATRSSGAIGFRDDQGSDSRMISFVVLVRAFLMPSKLIVGRERGRAEVADKQPFIVRGHRRHLGVVGIRSVANAPAPR